MDALHHIEPIIKKEIAIYNQLLAIEEQKKDAIIAFNGEQLFLFSKEQEKYVHELEHLEAARQNVLNNATKQGLQQGNISLKDFIMIASANNTENVVLLGYELKKKIEKFSRLYEGNKKLINDNMEFFNIILSSLRKATSYETGYGPEGLAMRSASGAVLMNKTV